MSKEKQIVVEEMAKVLIDYTKKCRIMASTAILTDYAEVLYEKSYRKQKEGEWIVSRSPIVGDYTITCSCCGRRERRGPAWDISWGVSAFCPGCGARMKGGDE